MGRFMCLIMGFLLVVLIVVYFMCLLMGLMWVLIVGFMFKYIFYNQIIQIILQYMDYKGLILE